MAKDNDLDGFLSDLDKLDDFGTKDNQTISKPSSKREAVSSTLKNTASSVLRQLYQLLYPMMLMLRYPILASWLLM